MEHVPPPAEELALLDRELARLDARRAQLLARRAWLVGVLSRPVARPAAPFGPPRPVRPPTAFAPPSAPPRAPGGTRNAQNVLLALGGLLLAIAAIAFTLVSWGEMGIGGRSAVLTAVTAAALAAPAPLLRRGLPATAESFAALASVLMVLDAYALHRVVMPRADGPGFAAVASAVLAALWAGYGLLLGRLRLPLPLAVVSAQLPLPLCAWWAGAGASAFGWALVVTAAMDAAIALRGRGVAVRVTACAGCWTVGPVGLLVALAQSVSAGTAWAALGPGVLLLAGAAVAVAGAWRAPSGFAVAGGVLAGWCAVAAVGGVLCAGPPGTWSVPVYLLCGAALLAAVRAPVPRPVGQGLVWSSSAVVAGAVLASMPPVGLSLIGAAYRLAGVWTGAPDGGVRGASAATWSQMASAPVVLLMVAALSGAVHRWWPRTVRFVGPVLVPGPVWRGVAGAAAVALGWAGCTVTPAVLGLPHPVAVVAQLAVVAALFAVAVRSLSRGTDAVGPTALVCGAVGAGTAGLWALATEATTYAASGVLLVVLGAAAVALDGPATSAARAVPTPSAVEATRTMWTLRIAQAVAACGAVLCATVLAVAAGASLGLSAHRAAPVLLVVPAATALLGTWLRSRPPALAVESAGAVAAVVSVGMAMPDRASLALVLALCGTVAVGTAVRPERRPAAGYLSTGLFVLAAWLRLSASGISAPEAYTLPVTVPALVVGALLRRRDSGASSWTAYGPGLAITLVPSLFAAWSDPHWVRPLLLGVAALAVTLAGARQRLQALLLLGGAVLTLDALHELAPYVVQVVGALPRWMPLALAGALLLAVGATYEQRLRDARRLKNALGRMR
ncbi:SCO7613 C-terminal domain-containing membrane protein [Streptomyces sp. NPDC014734]|uniref:SCO7613 C-terminal domain-containing membrane protein n=1 Tax=Streptomyces sp. NPDC014734 TaxID=3364886 RepID=UPI0036FFDE6B